MRRALRAVRHIPLLVVLAIAVASTVARAQEYTPQGSGSTGDARITISLKDQPLKEVARVIQEKSGINIVVADEIEETVTVELNRVPWRLALEIVADKSGCVLVQKATNLIRIEQPPRVNFEFTGAEVKEVIDAIAKVAGASVVTAPNVEGKVYLRIKDVPWKTALETVTKSLGYVVVEEEWGIFRVVSPETLETQMITRVFPIKYLRPPPPYDPKMETLYAEKRTSAGSGNTANEGFTLISALENALSGKGTLRYYSRNNIIVVKDIPPVIEEIERILAEIDVEPAQVFIDVKFVTTSDNDALSYGFDISDEGFRVGISGSSIPSRLPFAIGGGFGGDIVPDADGSGVVGLPADGILAGTTFGNLDFTNATFTLNLLKRDEGARLVQAPKLLALDNQEATIFVGRTIRYAETEAQSNQNGGLTYSIREARNSPVQTGFQLYIVPHIVPGTNKIIMTVIPEAEQLVGTASDPQLAGFQVFTSGEGTPNEVSIALPQVAQTAMVSTLKLESGETAVIGGLITEQETETINKIPVLGDIPVLGFFFKSTRRATRNESLFIFITPRIIRDNDTYTRILAEEARERQLAIEREIENIWGAGMRKSADEAQDD
jgi:type IV pilus assembly protein PilQ